MFFQIYHHSRIGVLLALVFLILSAPLSSNAREIELLDQKLSIIFPEAKKFVQRNPVLTSNQIVSIEEKLGIKLQSEDLKPVFYIPISNEKKPMGLVFFTEARGPLGIIEGAVGLDMKGKVVKVKIYRHKESNAIASEEFLKQFISMGIDNVFKAGMDVDAIEGLEDASNAVALIPKKTLVMSYALFLKKTPKPETEKTPEPDTSEPDLPEKEMPEVEDLKALMALMVDDYFVIVDYFDDKESKTNAVQASKRLARYGKSISNFEPPKNVDQTEEYAYLQNRFSEALLKFAEALEERGVSDETREQWDAIVTLINQSHLRFSEEEIDLDTY